MLLTRMEKFLPWSALNGDIERLDREYNGLFGGFGERAAVSRPTCNVWLDDDSVALTTELPGVKMEDVEITVSGSTVTVKGVRKEETMEGAALIRRERASGEFSRSMELPFRIDASKVTAQLADGVLKLTLPRSEADKPRKIAIRVG